MKKYSVNVFSKSSNHANNCTVLIINKIISRHEMQKIAFDLGHSETAFIAKIDEQFILRIFSPQQEMLSCIHASLAGLYVFENFIKTHGRQKLTLNGAALRGTVNHNLLELIVDKVENSKIDLKPEHLCLPKHLSGQDYWTASTASGRKRLMIEMSTIAEVLEVCAHEIAYIDSLLAEVESYFTYAPTDCSGQHFYGRMFAPKLGIPEDPVNGNSCIALFSKLLMLKPSLSKVGFTQNNGALFCLENLGKDCKLITECHLQ